MKLQIKAFAIIGLLSIMSLSNAKAQEKGTREFSINIGSGTTNDIIDIASDISTTLFTLGHVSYKDSKSTPSIGLTYKYAVKNKWMLLADACYQSRKKTHLVQIQKLTLLTEIIILLA